MNSESFSSKSKSKMNSEISIGSGSGSGASPSPPDSPSSVLRSISSKNEITAQALAVTDPLLVSPLNVPSHPENGAALVDKAEKAHKGPDEKAKRKLLTYAERRLALERALDDAGKKLALEKAVSEATAEKVVSEATAEKAHKGPDEKAKMKLLTMEKAVSEATAEKVVVSEATAENAVSEATAEKVVNEQAVDEEDPNERKLREFAQRVSAMPNSELPPYLKVEFSFEDGDSDSAE